MLFSYYLFIKIALLGGVLNIKLFSWISSGNFYVTWGLLIDSVTCTMLIVVNTVSFLVHMYSIEYMSHDKKLPTFMGYLSLFTFFMLVLVTSDNFIQMFLGWEGVGVVSYLLINFWSTRVQANKSAIKAIIVNRIGDFFLSLGIVSIFIIFRSFDFGLVFSIVSNISGNFFQIFGININYISLISLFIFLGAVGKSAQLGLHTWLPDAMEGPTPVSALIHAATMVTAGVFVLIRVSMILDYSSHILIFITILGGFTAFFAASVALFQNDLKRVIAYSTCSQLGYMVFVIGLSGYSVSMFHLMNHAFFKALLFLSAGSIIHAMSDEQDMRKLGGLVRLLPLTYVMILIGSMALFGTPFLTGFYSKDVILELALVSYRFDGILVFWLGTLTACFTAFYSIRLIYLTFLTKPNGYKNVLFVVHEPSKIMLFPLFVLACGSIFVGYLFKDLFIGIGTPFWGNSISVLSSHINILEAEYAYWYLKLIPVVFSIIGAVVSFLIYAYIYRFTLKLWQFDFNIKLYWFFSKKWYFDLIYNNFIVINILWAAYYIMFKILDRGFIEWVGPYGLVKLIRSLSIKVSKMQTGYLYNYFFIMLLGVVYFLTFLGYYIYFNGVWDLVFVYLFVTVYTMFLSTIFENKK
jgi:proton-translocating NADH-quinone oxidoreductase chain L